MDRNLGTMLVVGGLVLAAVGVLASVGGLRWFGRLPGDIRLEVGSGRVYFPLTSMVLVSVVLSVVLNLLGRWR